MLITITIILETYALVLWHPGLDQTLKIPYMTLRQCQAALQEFDGVPHAVARCEIAKPCPGREPCSL